MPDVERLQSIAEAKGGKYVSQYRNKITWECEEGHRFQLSMSKVHRRGKWCTQCGSSKGERIIRKTLNTLGIKFIPEYTLSQLPSRRYDYYFEYNNHRYLLEYDGKQHFEYVRKFHRTKKKFNECQVIDRVKTYVAWSTGHNLIRIDYTQESNIGYHIMKALSMDLVVYLSSAEMYRYLESGITAEQLKIYRKS